MRLYGRVLDCTFLLVQLHLNTSSAGAPQSELSMCSAVPGGDVPRAVPPAAPHRGVAGVHQRLLLCGHAGSGEGGGALVQRACTCAVECFPPAVVAWNTWTCGAAVLTHHPIWLAGGWLHPANRGECVDLRLFRLNPRPSPSCLRRSQRAMHLWTHPACPPPSFLAALVNESSHACKTVSMHSSATALRCTGRSGRAAHLPLPLLRHSSAAALRTECNSSSSPVSHAMLRIGDLHMGRSHCITRSLHWRPTSARAASPALARRALARRQRLHGCMASRAPRQRRCVL